MINKCQNEKFESEIDDCDNLNQKNKLNQRNNDFQSNQKNISEFLKIRVRDALSAQKSEETQSNLVFFSCIFDKFFEFLV